MIDPVLMRAHGKFVIFLASLLQAADIQTIGEFAETLAIFATVVAEEQPAEGDVLAYWAAGVRDLACGGSTAPTRDSSTAARRLFAMSRSIMGTPAGAYLRGRGLTDSSRALRFHPACWYRPVPHETADRDAWPAMIAAVTDLDGAITGVQRTWLDPGGAGKAEVASPRRSLGMLHGHGVRFGAAADVLLAGEGVETTLSIRTVLPKLSAIAALSAANLAGLLFPRRLHRLYVARDRDIAGEIAAAALAERCYEGGVELILLEPRQDDFNTDLVAHGPEALLRDVRRQLAPGDWARFAG